MDTLEALRMFVDVAEKGSFSAVARARALAVSTVTLAVQQLEQQLDTALMHRTTRRLTLTQEGERFLSDAERILADWGNSIELLKPNGPLRGSIFLTVPNNFGRTRLLVLLDRFMEQHPDISVRVLLSDNVIDLLEQRVDIALRTGPLSDFSLKSRLLLSGRRLVCAAPSYWQQYGKPSHPKDLQRYNCMYLAKPGVQRNVWQFVENGKALSVKVSGNRTANDGSALHRWAVLGQGTTLQMEWDILEDIKSGRLETALEPYANQQMGLYAVFSNSPSRRVSALVNFLADSLQGVTAESSD